MQQRKRVADHGESALRENVHLHQADLLDGIHVEVRGRIALRARERGRERGDGIARKHNAARVHFGVTREAVEERGHFERGLKRRKYISKRIGQTPEMPRQ